MASLIVYPSALRSIKVNTVIVNARLGLTAGYQIRLAKEEQALYVGTAKFVLVPINQYANEYDGTIRVVNNNELQVAINSQWFTTWSRSFTVDAASAANQLATVVITHGDQTVTMSNVVASEVKLRFYVDLPVNVTVYGIQIPGNKTVSFTNLTTPGQAYRIDFVLSTTVTGVPDQCVRYELDTQNAPTKSSHEFYREDSINIAVPGTYTTTAAAFEAGKQYILTLLTGGSSSFNDFINTTTVAEESLGIYTDASQSNTDNSPYLFLVSGVPFTVLANGDYIVRKGGVNAYFGTKTFTGMVAGSKYAFNYIVDRTSPIYNVYVLGSASPYTASINVAIRTKITGKLMGPIATFCAQTIDTRQTFYNVSVLNLTAIP